MHVDDPIIMRTQLEKLVDRSSDTIRNWMKNGTLPEPDLRANRQSIGWRRSTLERKGFMLFPERPANQPTEPASDA